MMTKQDFSRYQLRYAAGLYWLLDMEQEGNGYRRPLPLNETGADIWRALAEEGETDAAAEMLCKKYGIGKDEAGEDVRRFCRQLEAEGIMDQGSRG